MPLFAEGLLVALSHITGGGLPDNLPRVLPDDCGVAIDLASWKLPPVFGWLRGVGKLEDGELLRTFNAGIGMVLVVRAGNVARCMELLEGAGETDVVEMGVVEGRNGAQVKFSGALS